MNLKSIFIKRYVKARNEAILSADLRKCKAFMEKYGIAPPPAGDVAIMRGFQIALGGVTDITEEERREAFGKYRDWLVGHGYLTGQFGE